MKVLKKLDKEEKELIEETFGEIKTFVPENFEQTEEEKQRENLNNPYIIPFDERSFFSKQCNDHVFKYCYSFTTK